jgi:hypothetical protein
MTKQEIQNLIGKNKTEQAIFEMKKYCKDKIIEINILESKFTSLKNANLIGIILFQEYNMGIAQVNYGLLGILNDYEEVEPQKKDKDEFTQTRILDIKNILKLLYRLLKDYNEKLILEEDPKSKMQCEKEIAELKTNILKFENELNDLN